MNKINIAVIGASGYTGVELVRLLCNHEYVNIKYLTTRTYCNEEYVNVYPYLKHILNNIKCIDDSELENISNDVDCIFLALPHGVTSSRVNKDILKKTKIIDLSADFRIKDVNVYEKWYNCIHNCPELLLQSVYGLSEVYRDEIKNSSLIANAGCYTTCSILTLLPLVKFNLIDIDSIIIDAKSGVTGSGKSLKLSSLFCEVNESVKAYSIGAHRHTPEIEQELSKSCGNDIKVQFTPHLVPMSRGILTTCYAKLKKNINIKQVEEAYKEQYNNEFFVRLLNKDVFPETRFVKGSNFIDINYFCDERTGNIVAIGAIDNLIKGASGQAIQNMNIMFGFDEKHSLLQSGML